MDISLVSINEMLEELARRKLQFVFASMDPKAMLNSEDPSWHIKLYGNDAILRSLLIMIDKEIEATSDQLKPRADAD